MIHSIIFTLQPIQNGLLPASLRLLNTVNKNCHWLDSNCRSLVWATALPNVPKPLTMVLTNLWCNQLEAICDPRLLDHDEVVFRQAERMVIREAGRHPVIGKYQIWLLLNGWWKGLRSSPTHCFKGTLHRTRSYGRRLMSWRLWVGIPVPHTR